jgi:hypothetical protein
MSHRPFPTIDTSLLDAPPVSRRKADEWPQPPYAWRHAAVAAEGPRPCRIETVNGTSITAQLLSVDWARESLAITVSAGGTPARVPFASFVRLTLTDPLKPMLNAQGAPVRPLPIAAERRHHRIHLARRDAVLEGYTVGYLEEAEGLFLFVPTPDEQGLLRAFLPRTACSRYEFSSTAEEAAARHWVATPEALLQALAAQSSKPIPPLGRSLLDLGLITDEQLQRALQASASDRPLGERLVSAGLLTRSGLQTALAHKMGYPIIDLTRFPVDPAAVQLVPLRLALSSRALPVMIHDARLIVATESTLRLQKLKEVGQTAGLTVVPALAPRHQIRAMLSRLWQRDVWSHNVTDSPSGFFATTV